MTAPSSAPSPNDPYRECETYLKHGACVCSTGYPATCTAPQSPLEDLRQRLYEKAFLLDAMADDERSDGLHHEVSRLRGKAEGVRLAVSFVEEIVRGA